MGLDIQHADTSRLAPVMQTAANSLSFLMEDLQVRLPENTGVANTSADVEAWINVLKDQTTSLVASSSGRANLEEWLALVDAQVR